MASLVRVSQVTPIPPLFLPLPLPSPRASLPLKQKVVPLSTRARMRRGCLSALYPPVKYSISPTAGTVRIHRVTVIVI
jgi:hypothetical protein